MSQKKANSAYHSSFTKKVVDISVSTVGIILLIPLMAIIGASVWLTSPGPILFKQKRVGRNGKVFKMLKFRTMLKGAEKQQFRYRHLNEADGPVFKLSNDPRFTTFGRFLARTGLDELPQFINVIAGEMSIVGPRPLPVPEANKLTRVQKIRLLIKPGITSSWVTSGSHRLTFDKWMELDQRYIVSGNAREDVKILIKTGYLMSKQVVRQFLVLLHLYNRS